MKLSPLNFRLHPGLALAPLTALLLVACASTPATNASLEAARSIYTQASSDADTARSAPLDLRRSQEALQRGDAALRDGEDVSTVEHYAYLARQSAATALQSGEIARSEQAVTASAAERNRILLTARGAEADRARAQAEQARMQAEMARNQAQQQGAAAQAAQARLATLQQQMAELKAQQTDRGMVLTLGDVLFDTGRAELKVGAFATLDRLATFMRDNPERTLEVEGYTDSTGSDALNQALSQRRAESVRGALVSRGVDGGRISTKGLGKESPVASNDTASGRQRNRRVEIVISNTR
jgi:outer membrane protein OmpA-like peptidoglycan-associated protein